MQIQNEKDKMIKKFINTELESESESGSDIKLELKPVLEPDVIATFLFKLILF